MLQTRSWRSLLLTSLLGSSVLVTGCVNVVVSPRPYMCPRLTEDIVDEYAALTRLTDPETTKLRAWVREADKACRANERLLKDSTQ